MTTRQASQGGPKALGSESVDRITDDAMVRAINSTRREAKEALNSLDGITPEIQGARARIREARELVKACGFSDIAEELAGARNELDLILRDLREASDELSRAEDAALAGAEAQEALEAWQDARRRAAGAACAPYPATRQEARTTASIAASVDKACRDADARILALDGAQL